MDIEKIRNLNPHELAHQELEAVEQIFRLRFQMKMGQTGGLKKMRELRKDLARIKTISRERALGLNANLGVAGAETPATPEPKTTKVAKQAGAGRAAKKAGRKTANKKAATEKK
jgi:large subunit ribosomal protein L29